MCEGGIRSAAATDLATNGKVAAVLRVDAHPVRRGVCLDLRRDLGRIFVPVLDYRVSVAGNKMAAMRQKQRESDQREGDSKKAPEREHRVEAKK